MDSHVDLRKIEVKWVIKDYVKASTGITNKHYLESPPLALSSSKYFRIILYPNGKYNTSKDYLSVYVQPFNCSFEGEASLYILNSYNEATNRLTTKARSFENNIHYGWRNFLKQSNLTSNPTLLRDGNLIIGCEIETELELSQSLTICNVVKTLDNSLLEKKLGKYEEFLENKTFSDVKFIVQGKEICGHKSIIASQSTVLAAMFESKMKECNENVVDITDISYNVMYELLRFIYAGRVEGIENVAVELLIASEKYLIEDLKTLCEKHLASKLTSQNVIQYLNLAECHNASFLKIQGINFITKHADTIADSPSFDVCKLNENILRKVFHSVSKSRKRKSNE